LLLVLLLLLLLVLLQLVLLLLAMVMVGVVLCCPLLLWLPPGRAQGHSPACVRGYGTMMSFDGVG